MRPLLANLFLCLLVINPVRAAASNLQLLVAHDTSCGDFARWQSEIGPGYAESNVGRAAPLLSVNIQGPWPNGLALASAPRQTPTFILLRNGQEIGRIEGYGDANRFLAQLNSLMKQDHSAAR
ncbi:thioredoxin family protein [Paracoccus albus]|uniref:thioredoxin family protein n=1 Tax=Paracoccus albus TaxID=3017784 RepID=UPI0022F1140E|nr:thioredoxin family protein [Paracoccus albus]WBU59768.1 thioredoxin family protein [Paracoccus albus]